MLRWRRRLLQLLLLLLWLLDLFLLPLVLVHQVCVSSWGMREVCLNGPTEMMVW
jgi:hypothetical protein